MDCGNITRKFWNNLGDCFLFVCLFLAFAFLIKPMFLFYSYKDLRRYVSSRKYDFNIYIDSTELWETAGEEYVNEQNGVGSISILHV